ncbi:MAG: hypothetical protein QG632_428 [Candidatus Dependentiae bacterium]|nr:hypothetical protein [Candidatus Dependentiae bacterium]
MFKKVVVFLFCSITAMHSVGAGAGRSAARWGGIGVGAAASLLIIAAQAKIKVLEKEVKRGTVALADADLERLYVLRNWAIGLVGLGGSLFAGSLLSSADQFEATPAVANPADREEVIVNVAHNATSQDATVSSVAPILPEPTVLLAPPALSESEPDPVVHAVTPLGELASTQEPAQAVPAVELTLPPAISPSKDAVVAEPMSVAVDLSSAAPLPLALVPSVKKPVAPLLSARRKRRSLRNIAMVRPLTVTKNDQSPVLGVIGATLSKSVAGNLTDDTVVQCFLRDLPVKDESGIAFFEADALVAYADSQVVSSAVNEITKLVSNDGASAEHFNFDFSLSRDQLFSLFHPVKIPGDGHCAGHCYIFFKSGLANTSRQPYYFGASFDALAGARKLLFQQRLAQVPKKQRNSVKRELCTFIGMGHWKFWARTWETDMPRLQINTSLPAPVDSKYYLGEEDVLLIAKMLHKPVLIWTGADESGYRISYSAGLSQERWKKAKQDLASCCHILFSQAGTELNIGGRGHWSVLVPNPLRSETQKGSEK